MAQQQPSIDDAINGVDRFIAKQKERFAEFGDKQNELQARLQEVEQLVARRGSDDSRAAPERRELFGRATAESIIAGLQDAPATRVAVPKLSIRVMAAALDSTSYEVPLQYLPPISTEHPPIARLVNLLPSRPVTGNSIVYTRVRWSANSPEDGNLAAKVAERAPKPESRIETEPVTLTIPTFAHWLDASKQILDDVSELQAILDGMLRQGLLDVVDQDVYTTLTTGGNYTSFTPESGETIGDGVARIAAQIARVGGSNIVVALAPDDWLQMSLTKAEDSGVYLGVPQNLASRVVAVPAITEGKVIAFAPGTGASWADREGVSVQVGMKNDDFTRNIRTFLCEARGATLVRDAQHVAYGDITTA